MAFFVCLFLYQHLLFKLTIVIKKILIHPTDKTIIQFFRYFIVGGLAFIVDFVFLYLLTNKFRLYYLFSAAISFTLGLIVNYFFSKTWVFNKAVLKNKFIEFGIFALIGLVGLAINEIFIWFFTEKGHIYYLLSKILTAFFVFLWNFFARKFTLFK